MIGILCSNNKEREYAVQLNSLFRETGSEKDDSIIVFTISNIDLSNNTVTGSLIPKKELERVIVPLPSVIFNFSLQLESEGIRIRKTLEDMEEIELINDVNKFDQWMIMEMLSSSKIAHRYMLKYNIYNKVFRDFKPDDDKAYIVMPSRGASLSRLIYARPESDSDMVSGTQYFKKGHICDYIDASMYQNRWIFIEVPELLICDDHPVIVRTYLQKSSFKSWGILGTAIHPNTELEDRSVIQKGNEAALSVVSYVGHFLPSLGHCFIDVIVSTEGNPYFLHLGGFEQHFFEKIQNEETGKQLYRNILTLSRYYNRKHKEE